MRGVSRKVKAGWVLGVLLAAGCSAGTGGNEAATRMFWATVDSPQRDRDPLTARVEEAIGLRSGMRVADVGAGGGYFSFRFARVVGRGGHVFATDVDPVMVERMRAARVARGVANLEVLRVDGDELGLALGSVDRIVMVNSVSFAACELDGESYLRACHRSLRDGGRLVVMRERRHTTAWSPPYGRAPECDEPSAEEITAMGRGLFRATQNDPVDRDAPMARGEYAGFLLALEPSIIEESRIRSTVRERARTGSFQPESGLDRSRLEMSR